MIQSCYSVINISLFLEIMSMVCLCLQIKEEKLDLN